MPRKPLIAKYLQLVVYLWLNAPAGCPLSVLRTKYHLTLMRLKPKIMHQHERGYLIIPHEVATGADCDGCIIVEERGDMADLKCNCCGAVIDTVSH